MRVENFANVLLDFIEGSVMRRLMKYVLFVLIAVSFIANAQIEKWVDENGKTHYGTRAPSGRDTQNDEVPKFQPTNSSVAKKERVVLYSTSWCPYCKKAKAYLNKNRIAFTEYDIEKDATAKRNYKSLGGRGVPFLVRGSDVQGGFSAEKYDAFFKR